MVLRTCLLFPVVLRGRPETSACSSAGEPTTSKPWRPRMCVPGQCTAGTIEGMKRLLLLAALTGLAAVATSGAGASRDDLTPCKGADLTGSFGVSPGSAGAGNIVYVLRLRNASHAMCFVTG